MSRSVPIRTCLVGLALALVGGAIGLIGSSGAAGSGTPDPGARGQSACAEAKDDLRSAKRKLRKLQANDASQQKIQRAKRRVRRAKAAVEEACEAEGRFTLTINKLGDGEGRVTSDPSGIDCGPSCSRQFRAGTEITLTADADPGSTFTSWQGGCSGTGDCVVTLTQDREIRAFFDAPGPRSPSD
jgi:hypothetical protein